jgi:hypothetical protein
LPQRNIRSSIGIATVSIGLRRRRSLTKIKGIGWAGIAEAPHLAAAQKSWSRSR